MEICIAAVLRRIFAGRLQDGGPTVRGAAFSLFLGSLTSSSRGAQPSRLAD